MDNRPADVWFQALVRHAALAGACRARARGERYAAPALRKLARRHSLEAANLLERQIPARKLPRRARRK